MSTTREEEIGGKASASLCESCSIEWWCRAMKHKQRQLHRQQQPFCLQVTFFVEEELPLLVQSHQPAAAELLETNHAGNEPNQSDHDGDAAISNDGNKFSTRLIGKAICDFWYPPGIPPELQLFKLENVAIPACYWMVGTCQGMVGTFLNVFPVAIGASEAQQVTLSSICNLGASLKLLYGFTSDNFPICGGYRRKPYIFLGWFLSSAAMLYLWIFFDWRGISIILLNDSTSHENNNILSTSLNDGLSPPSKPLPSVVVLGLTFCAFGVGMWLADATADAMVAEKARLCEMLLATEKGNDESHETKSKSNTTAKRGDLQSTCYMLRFFGIMVAAPLSTWMYSDVGPLVLVRILGLLPCLVMLPLALFLSENRNAPIPSTAEQCREIWNTLCSRSAWEPMAFLFLFNLLQVSNAAWRQFLVTVLGFSAIQLNILLVASYALLYFGTAVYKYWFLQASWRTIYQVSMLLNAILSLLQLCLIRGNTFGLSPFLFALGDDAFMEFLSGMQFLPMAIMLMTLCPPGSEGASYAMFTTANNSALLLSPALSSLLLGIWDVSAETLAARELGGMFKLSILTTVIQLSPIFILSSLPENVDDLHALASKSRSSCMGGILFLVVLFASMTWTVTIAILNIAAPG